RLIRFRHFIDGSLALASHNRACQDLAPAFPQRSPPWLLTTAACGGLRSAHDSRPRRALLHHSYSWAPPIFRRCVRDTRPTTEVEQPILLWRTTLSFKDVVGCSPRFRGHHEATGIHHL